MPLSVAHIETLLIFIRLDRGEPSRPELRLGGEGGFFPGAPVLARVGARRRAARASIGSSGRTAPMRKRSPWKGFNPLGFKELGGNSLKKREGSPELIVISVTPF
jgi:hypothetical protein